MSGYIGRGTSVAIVNGVEDTNNIVDVTTDTLSVDGTVDASAFTQDGSPLEAGAKEGIFWENGTTVTTNYTITAGKNAGTFGPVQIADGVVVTIPDGSTWTVV
jgi:hypothetical protein